VFYLRDFAVADADDHQANAAIVGLFEHASEAEKGRGDEPGSADVVSARIRVRQ
jgi:hypothetical protein